MLGTLLVGLSAVAMGPLKSRGLTAWLWLVRTTGQVKADKKPLSWLGLQAWLGLAPGLRPGWAQH